MIFLWSVSTLKSLMISFMPHFQFNISRSSILSTLVSSWILIFVPFLERKSGSLWLLYKDLIVPFWFTCFIRTYILHHLVVPSRWPCLVRSFKSLFSQSGMYSAWLDLMHVSLLAFQRFRLSLLVCLSLFQFLYMVLLKSFPHMFH